MAYVWPLLMANAFHLASSASLHHAKVAAPDMVLTSQRKAIANRQAPIALGVASSHQVGLPCLPDIPGGRWAAGATMAGGIALTAAVTVALMAYVIRMRSESLTLPGLNGDARPGSSGNAPGDASDVAKPAGAKKKRVHIHPLDGMRVLLVLGVIFAHYPLGLPEIFKHFLGWPMQFFFVLSGFVAQVQQETGSEQFSWLSGVTYLTRRLFRILPLYQLALVFQYGLWIIDKRQCEPVLAWPMNALLLQTFFPVRVCGEPDLAWTQGYTHFNGNGPAWFAACIVWCSCFFPLLYNLRPRSGSIHTFGLLVAMLACRALPDMINPKWGNYGTGAHLYACFPVRILEYAAGMWAAQLAAEMSNRWQTWNCWCWFFDVSLLMLAATVYISLNYLGAHWLCSGDYHITAICCLVCFTARLAAEMPDESRQGLRGAVLHRVIGSTPMTYLARFAFAAYIFQTSFMSMTDEDQNFYFWRFCLLWLFAIFATLYIEEPIRLAGEARLKGQ